MPGFLPPFEPNDVFAPPTYSTSQCIDCGRSIRFMGEQPSLRCRICNGIMSTENPLSGCGAKFAYSFGCGNTQTIGLCGENLLCPSCATAKNRRILDLETRLSAYE